MPIEAIEPRRLYRRIADQLRLLIDQGEFPVGSRLPAERELASQLGVSRPTVREALIALEVEGRLKIRVGSGVYVIEQQPTPAILNSASIEGPFEILRARAFVESAVAEEAARRAKPADITRLDEVLCDAQDFVGDEFLMVDRRFHTAIAGILDNGVLVRCVGELFDLRINPYFELLARHTEDATARLFAHSEHVAIRDAIAAGSPAKARAAMHEHLKRSHQRFARDFGEQPATDQGTEGRGGLKATA